MKLILLTAFLIKHTVIANEQFPFPPHFHKPNSPAFGSDSSIFLPPEAHTPVPYYPMKNVNNLPFPYLPPTGTKAPSMFPSPFPVILSSTLVPIFDDDDEDGNNHEPIKNNKLRLSSPLPPMPQMKQNNTENQSRPQPQIKREMRATPKMGNFHNPNERVDMRFASQFPMGPTTPNPSYQTQRNMIIDTHRHDIGIDQMKAASIQNPHYLAAPGFTISSTEPAVPIIRLSNEMDLDGSFSYEALGADQTHYVQHSHMENLGTDKQEQVVEGSYSYVGDNGQTYTVHYIADSNGFRASGDHLPVAPPVPEIIQRAVQYNLAEEAKKPPHLRNWNEEEKLFENSDRNPPFSVPPTRNLFTGRTPEAFSYSFAQGTNNENNLVAASSSQVPVKSNSDYIIDQTKPKLNNGLITPQITFLASQGAHVPGMNQQTAQQSISRIFNNNEKPNMPQLMNYDAGNKETDQEGNKGLWRWQYGLNSNNLSQAPEKNTISRSFGEGDDIMINFGDMTSDQYTRMLQQQLDTNQQSSPSSKFPDMNQNMYSSNQYSNNIQHNNMNEYQNHNNPQNTYYATGSTETQNQPTLPPQPTTTISHSYSSSAEPKPKYELSQALSPPSPPKNPDLYQHTEYKTRDYSESPHDFKRLKALRVETTTRPSIYNINAIPFPNNNQKPNYNVWTNHKRFNEEPNTITQVPAFYSTLTAPKVLDIHEYKTEFKPIIQQIEEKQETSTASTETTTEDIFNTNIFLKHIVQEKKSDVQNANKKTDEEPKKTVVNKNPSESKSIMSVLQNKVLAETKADKIPKFVPYHTKSISDIKSMKKKPMDLSEVINFMTNRNLFESNKIKPKTHNINYHNQDQRNEMPHEPWNTEEHDEEESDYDVPQQISNVRNLNNQEHEELRGIIKNYKVLQRNNNAKNYESQQKEVSVPSVKMLQSAGLPPLGRAGPSMKTYLPPIYV